MAIFYWKIHDKVVRDIENYCPFGKFKLRHGQGYDQIYLRVKI
jgi:hypothetical protein